MTSAFRGLRGPLAGGPLFKTTGIALIAVLALAFYLVCSLQVRKAEARKTAVQVHQAAFNDCLQYVVGSTIGGCISRLGAQQPAAEEAPPAGPGLDIATR